MHRGVRDFIRWVEQHRDTDLVKLEAPVSAETLATLEQQLGVPLPADLRFVLTRFNGAVLPSGTLLPAGTGPGTIEAAVRDFAEQVEADFLDPELLLPFHNTQEGSLLAFDRSAGPVSDTWPIVDYFPDTGEIRLVHRTFDGWCENCLADWSSPDFGEDFSLDTYLRQGERHAQVEPDVASAHATVAHACRRAGLPERALESYLRAARCVPSLPWCDWEALKLSVLLDKPRSALEAASRLATPAPSERWEERDTTPGQVADLAALMAARLEPHEHGPWLRLFDTLAHEASDDEERNHVMEIRKRVVSGQPPPRPRSLRPTAVHPTDDTETWWKQVQAAYVAGQIRDDDLLLDPKLRPLSTKRPFDALLRMRRDF